MPQHDESMHKDPSHPNGAVEIGSFTPGRLTVLSRGSHVVRHLTGSFPHLEARGTSVYHAVVNTT